MRVRLVKTLPLKILSTLPNHIRFYVQFLVHCLKEFDSPYLPGSTSLDTNILMIAYVAWFVVKNVHKCYQHCITFATSNSN